MDGSDNGNLSCCNSSTDHLTAGGWSLGTNCRKSHRMAVNSLDDPLALCLLWPYPCSPPPHAVTPFNYSLIGLQALPCTLQTRPTSGSQH